MTADHWLLATIFLTAVIAWATCQPGAQELDGWLDLSDPRRTDGYGADTPLLHPPTNGSPRLRGNGQAHAGRRNTDAGPLDRTTSFDLQREAPTLNGNAGSGHARMPSSPQPSMPIEEVVQFNWQVEGYRGENPLEWHAANGRTSSNQSGLDCGQFTMQWNSTLHELARLVNWREDFLMMMNPQLPNQSNTLLPSGTTVQLPCPIAQPGSKLHIGVAVCSKFTMPMEVEKRNLTEHARLLGLSVPDLLAANPEWTLAQLQEPGREVNVPCSSVQAKNLPSPGYMAWLASSDTGLADTPMWALAHLEEPGGELILPGPGGGTEMRNTPSFEQVVWQAGSEAGGADAHMQQVVLSGGGVLYGVRAGQLMLLASLEADWTVVDDGGRKWRSVSILDDGSILAIADDWSAYRKPSIHDPWSNALPGSCCTKDIKQVGSRYIGIGSDNYLWGRDQGLDIRADWFKFDGQSKFITALHVRSDGGIIGVGLDFYLYALPDGLLKTNTVGKWVQLENSCCVVSVTELGNGVIVGVDRVGNLHTRESLSVGVYGQWRVVGSDGSKRPVSAIAMAGLQGTAYPAGAAALLGILSSNKLAMKWSLTGNWGTIEELPAAMRSVAVAGDGTIIGVSSDFYIHKKISLGSPWVASGIGGVLDVKQVGTRYVGVGGDNFLYARKSLDRGSPDWYRLAGDDLRISAFHVRRDGSIVAVGVDRQLYTTSHLLLNQTGPWTLVPDSCCVASITELADGTILGVHTETKKLWKRKPLDGKWEYAADGPLTAITMAPAGPQYVGCFEDEVPGVGRAMYWIAESAIMTVESCRNLALSNGNKFYGLQFGKQCFGSNDPVKAVAPGPSKDCNVGCAGTDLQTCGGVYVNSLYATGVGGYVGCYGDNPTRAMALLSTTSNLTLEYCRDLAVKAGKQYFGVQYSTACFGTNDLAAATSYGVKQGCNMVCSGDAMQVCGGAWANSIFDTAYGGDVLPGGIKSGSTGGQLSGGRGDAVAEQFKGCFASSVPREMLGMPNACPSDKPSGSNGLCYDHCPSGYNGIANICYGRCPDGYTDTGLLCSRGSQRQEASGQCPAYDICGLILARGCKSCPSGWRWDGCYCWVDSNTVAKASTWRAGGVLPICSTGTKEGGLCYSSCPPNFSTLPGSPSLCWFEHKSSRVESMFPIDCGSHNFYARDDEACRDVISKFVAVEVTSGAQVVCIIASVASGGVISPVCTELLESQLTAALELIVELAVFTRNCVDL